MTRRAAIVGDIHGCLEEARKCLARLRELGLTRQDELVLLGDLLDKGPDPVGVVRMFREEQEAGQRTVLVLGNHEERHARWRKAEAQTITGKPNKMLDGSGALRATSSALCTEDIAFLDSALLWHELVWAESLVVHGGILPEMLPDEARLPDLDSLDSYSRKQRDRIRRVLRLRYWRPSAHERGFVPMGSEQPGDRYWAELYDGRFGHVYFGHEPFVDAEAPVEFPHATALDLGVVHGNRLAAVLLSEDSGPRPALVPALATYRERGEPA